MALGRLGRLGMLGSGRPVLSNEKLGKLSSLKLVRLGWLGRFGWLGWLDWLGELLAGVVSDTGTCEVVGVDWCGTNTDDNPDGDEDETVDESATLFALGPSPGAAAHEGTNVALA